MGAEFETRSPADVFLDFGTGMGKGSAEPETFPPRPSITLAMSARGSPTRRHQEFRPNVIGSAWTPWLRPITVFVLQRACVIVSRDGDALSKQLARFLVCWRAWYREQVGRRGRMHVSRSLPMCSANCQKGDDVVVGDFLDFEDALGVEARVLLDARDRLGGDFSQLGQRFARQDFKFKPLGKFVFVGPDAAHVGERVTFDHISPGRSASVTLSFNN